MFQQPLLGCQTTGKTGQGAIAANHPVARDDDRDRIAPVRRPHCTGRFGPVDLLRNLAVTGGQRIRNGGQRLPDRLLKVGAQRFEKQVKRLTLTRKIFLQLTANFCELLWRMHPTFLRCMGPTVQLKTHFAQTCIIGDQEQRPNR